MITTLPSETPGWVLPEEASVELRSFALEIALARGADLEVAEDIAQTTVIRLNDAARRSPAVLCVLTGPRRRPIVADAARRVLATHRLTEARAVPSLTGEQMAELEELEAALHMASLSVRLSHDEQLFLHLRYFQGNTIREVAKTLGLTIVQTRILGSGAIRTLEAALRNEELIGLGQGPRT